MLVALGPERYNRSRLPNRAFTSSPCWPRRQVARIVKRPFRRWSGHGARFRRPDISHVVLARRSAGSVSGPPTNRTASQPLPISPPESTAQPQEQACSARTTMKPKTHLRRRASSPFNGSDKATASVGRALTTLRKPSLGTPTHHRLTVCWQRSILG